MRNHRRAERGFHRQVLQKPPQMFGVQGQRRDAEPGVERATKAAPLVRLKRWP